MTSWEKVLKYTQNFILSPALFNVIINDLNEALENIVRFVGKNIKGSSGFRRGLDKTQEDESQQRQTLVVHLRGKN